MFCKKSSLRKPGPDPLELETVTLADLPELGSVELVAVPEVGWAVELLEVGGVDEGAWSEGVVPEVPNLITIVKLRMY